ncbi:hypothetical protein PIB30_057353 [Stylosanthes scabra]|uniref:C2H2-type domain-containing protein n=1 Tax=Stylosanthes scabra TaxID=79078 RepID=A0ABU6WK59_9FABA|nr:hypothetical protein [Stylosanthes scabra]
MSSTSSSSSSPVNQPWPSSKGKEKVTYDDVMNKGNKGIHIKEPEDHLYYDNSSSSSDDDLHGLMDPNNTDDGSAADEESSDDSTEEGESSPDNTVTVDGSRNSPRDKSVYNCSYCAKSFSSPQALGGHQNGHKMERLYQSHTHNSIGNGVEYLNNISMGSGMSVGMTPSPSSFMQLPPSPTIPPFRPVFRGGANSLHHHQPMNVMMGNNNLDINNSYNPYHHDGLFQNNAARPSNLFRPVPVPAGIAYSHAGSGAVGVGNMMGAFQPNIAYPGAGSGSGAVGIGSISGAFHDQRPYEFQNRGLYGGASEHPLPRRPPMAAAGIGRIRDEEDEDNSGGVNKRRRLNEPCETQQGGIEFVLLPSAARNNNDTKVEIDFGLVPKRD